MTKAKRHTHKYHQINLSSQKVWACALPDCNHYMPKHLDETVPGKKSICWKCETEFILNASNMSQRKPVCDGCSGMEDIQEYLKEKGLIDSLE